MPTDFAKNLSRRLCEFFAISASELEKEELSSAIDFHAQHLDERSKEDLEPLLFVECGEESRERQLTIKAAKTIVARVQKRILRDSRRYKQLPDDFVQAQGTADPGHFERVLKQFKAFLKSRLSLRDAIIFELYFIQGVGVSSICDRLRIQKSAVYERIRIVRQQFKVFLDDVCIPDFD